MNNIPISYLLDMSDIEATNWLIENCHDYVLVKRAAIKQLRAENEALRVMVSKLERSISGDFFREHERLLDEHSAMQDIMRDALRLMRATVETSGWHQVASVAESLVNSKFTTGQESQAAKDSK